jgi:hypothetical protein
VSHKHKINFGNALFSRGVEYDSTILHPITPLLIVVLVSIEVGTVSGSSTTFGNKKWSYAHQYFATYRLRHIISEFNYH